MCSFPFYIYNQSRWSITNQCTHTTTYCSDDHRGHVKLQNDPFSAKIRKYHSIFSLFLMVFFDDISVSCFHFARDAFAPRMSLLNIVVLVFLNRRLREDWNTCVITCFSFLIQLQKEWKVTNKFYYSIVFSHFLVELIFCRYIQPGRLLTEYFEIIYTVYSI